MVEKGQRDGAIGRFALVAAGALVVEDVPDFALVQGVPGRVVRYVCPVGLRHPVVQRVEGLWCTECDRLLDSIVRGT